MFSGVILVECFLALIPPLNQMALFYFILNLLNSAASFKAFLFGILRKYEKLDQMPSTLLFLSSLIINLKATFMFKG